jgi:hypothetical protein
MAARNVAYLVTALALALLLAACGGSGAVQDHSGLNASQQAFSAWLAGVDLNPVIPGAEGLPGIPLDKASDARRTSAVESPVVRLGVDHIAAMNYVDDGTAVRLEAPGSGGEGHPALAYAMYKVEGLAGLRPTLLDVQATPGGLEQSYFVGVADYTLMNWHWFGPYTLPEIEVNLAEPAHRYVSAAGNLYFLTVVHEGMSLTHQQSSLFLDEQGDSRLPGAPCGLQASDGDIADAVGLAWVPGPGSNYFEIFRKLDGHGDGANYDWTRLGESVEPNYLDQSVDPGVVYLYKVRAGNQNGLSGFSNVDSGFAGQAPPPDGFTIHGWVRTAASEGIVGDPVPCVAVTLFGPPQPITVQTDVDGAYLFGGLPAGTFIVVPHDPQKGFDPVYSKTVLGPEHPVAELNFAASLHEIPSWRIWGFTLTPSGDPLHPGFVPLPGVNVAIQSTSPAGEPFTVVSNADGFYAAYEQPVGLYAITPGMPEFTFDPPVRSVHVTHETVTEMQNFVGIPGGGGGGCVIEGNISGVDGAGLNDIAVNLVPVLDPASGGMTFTAQGHYRFGDLPVGKYLVVPNSPHMLFEPRYAIVVLEPGMVGHADFVGHVQDAYHRLWGFAYNLEGEAANGFAPMHGVLIEAHIDGGHDSVTAQTNADGFWEFTELANGTYIVTPGMDGFTFEPLHRVQFVDGTVITPPLFFQGSSPLL